VCPDPHPHDHPYGSNLRAAQVVGNEDDGDGELDNEFGHGNDFDPQYWPFQVSLALRCQHDSRTNITASFPYIIHLFLSHYVSLVYIWPIHFW